MDIIKQYMGSEYNDMIELLNGKVNEEDAIRMIMTTMGDPGREVDLTNIADSLRDFGFAPMTLQKNNNSYNFSASYDNISLSNEIKFDIQHDINIAVSYTQQPRKRGNNSMPSASKQGCNEKLIFIENVFGASATAVWFDKLAIKQAEKAQIYWAITSNIMFLILPVLSIAPRRDQYVLDEKFDEHRLKDAGIYDILIHHTKRIANCPKCWTKTHTLCSIKSDKNKHTMIEGGLWVDGWLRCWPEIERRLGASYKGTYVDAYDYLLILDTYMLISNIAKELFSNTGIDNTNALRHVGWLNELAWLQTTTSERKLDANESHISVNNSEWCDVCQDKLLSDILISVEEKSDQLRDKEWRSTIQLLEAIRESIKFITPLHGSAACCDNNCNLNATLDAYGKFNNPNGFGCNYLDPNALYMELVEEYKLAKSIKFHSLYGTISNIAYGAPGQAQCYREGDKIGAIIALMNLPILAHFIKNSGDTNIYKQLMVFKVPIQEENVWCTGLDYRNILPMQLYKRRGIYNHVIINRIKANTEFNDLCWLGSLQTELEQGALAQFLADIDLNDTGGVLRRAQYEAVRQVNTIGRIHVLKNKITSDTYILNCPSCMLTNSHWSSYNVVASMNPMASLVLAENNIGGQWHNSTFVVYDNERIVGHGYASISAMRQALERCHNNKHIFVRAVVSFGDFDNNPALLELRQCDINQNKVLRDNIIHYGDRSLGYVVSSFLV